MNNDIEVTNKQLEIVGKAVKRVNDLTIAAAAAAVKQDTETFNYLYTQRENAILDIRVVLLEQGLPVPPIKCSVILPF